MKHFYIVIFLCIEIGIIAQNDSDTIKIANEKKQSEFTITPSVAITNVHLWRAFASGTAPCIEPNINFKYKNLSLDMWASYAIDNSYKEIDFILTYSIKNFSIMFSDYYCPVAGKPEQFANLKNSETDHLFEIKTDFFISEKFPLSLSAAVFLAGSDVERVDGKVNQLYSTYFELSYPFNIVHTPIKLEVGMTPAKGMYADEAKIYNYGMTITKPIKISQKYSLPTQYKLVYNSDEDILHFAIILSLGY